MRRPQTLIDGSSFVRRAYYPLLRTYSPPRQRGRRRLSFANFCFL
jgi:hypothetical protein